jgi:glycosyltransferase involved in cell wall biosynthesis
MSDLLIRNGHSVDILCLSEPGRPAEEVYNGIQVKRLPVSHNQGKGASAYLREYSSFFTHAFVELRRRHRQQPYDLLQVPNPPDALAFSTLPLKLGRVPVILDLRELTPELFMSRFSLAPNSGFVRLLRWQERLSCAYADNVLILHERHRRIMMGRGVPPGKLTQVMNCPDDAVFDLVRPAPARPRDGKFVVVHNGGIFHRYGVDLLVESVARVREDIPCIELRLYGAGDFEPEVRRRVAELGLEPVVRFFGQQPLESMPAALSAADVGAVPMRQDVFTDCGLPTKLLEYVTLGIPSISSRTLTTSDYFDDSMVYYFEPGDVDGLARRLVEVYCDPSAAQAKAVRAQVFTEQNNWRTESARYLGLIDRLVAEKKGRRQ